MPARCPLPAFITSSLRNCAVLRARHVARGGIRAGGTPLSQRFPGQAASRAVRGRPSVALDVPVIGHAAGTLTPSSCLGRASLRAWQCSCGSCLVGPTPGAGRAPTPAARLRSPRSARPGYRARTCHARPAVTARSSGAGSARDDQLVAISSPASAPGNISVRIWNARTYRHSRHA